MTVEFNSMIIQIRGSDDLDARPLAVCVCVCVCEKNNSTH